MAGEHQEVEVAERRRDPQVRGGLHAFKKPGRGQARARARVQREDRGLRQRLEQLHQAPQPRRVVHVPGTVRSDEQVLAGRHAVIGQGSGALLRHRGERERHVRHHVANQLHPPVCTLAPQVLDRHGRRAQEQRARVVAEHSVELLGHRPVAGPHPRLHVRHRDPQLGGGKSAGECGVRIPVDQSQVRPPLAQHGLERREHPRRLLAGAARADVKLPVWSRYVELLEEDP